MLTLAQTARLSASGAARAQPRVGGARVRTQPGKPRPAADGWRSADGTRLTWPPSLNFAHGSGSQAEVRGCVRRYIAEAGQVAPISGAGKLARCCPGSDRLSDSGSAGPLTLLPSRRLITAA